MRQLERVHAISTGRGRCVHGRELLTSRPGQAPAGAQPPHERRPEMNEATCQAIAGDASDAMPYARQTLGRPALPRLALPQLDSLLAGSNREPHIGSIPRLHELML